MPEIELSAGTIEYEDTGGSGPVIVLVHGLAMDGSVWRRVVPDLGAEFRCVVPTLALGSHRRPMRPEADLSLRGHARILGEFLERLELRDVTLVQNDIGIGLVLAGQRPERVARLVLASCEAFDNYPPGLAGRLFVLAARLPGGFNALVQPMRLRPLRRLRLVYGGVAKRPIPHPVTDAWLHPLLTRREIRADVIKYLRAADRRDMVEATERLCSFDRPALVVWAAEDRLMPPEHGRRLAKLLPDARLVEIADSYTLIPEDQPGELARAIREFVRDTAQEPPDRRSHVRTHATS
jgi:pimeloyl-ACP methyl ester carboxylesterase